MRTLAFDYTCYFNYFKDGQFLDNHVNRACWKYVDTVLKFDIQEIYITNFKTKETSVYIPLIVEYINKLTPCEIVKIEKQDYIKFTLLKQYRKSLVLLNFIRYLWCSPKTYDHGKNNEFSLTFFKTLEQLNNTEDAFVNLTTANKAASEQIPVTHAIGHSNVFDYNRLKILTTKDFNEYNSATDLMYFFTTEE
jgi:hypothetical protein